MLRSRAHVSCLFRPFEIDSVFGSLHQTGSFAHTAQHILHSCIHGNWWVWHDGSLPTLDSLFALCVSVSMLHHRNCDNIFIGAIVWRWLWRPVQFSRSTLFRFHIFGNDSWSVSFYVHLIFTRNPIYPEIAERTIHYVYVYAPGMRDMPGISSCRRSQFRNNNNSSTNRKKNGKL